MDTVGLKKIIVIAAKKKNILHYSVSYLRMPYAYFEKKNKLKKNVKFGALFLNYIIFSVEVQI